MGITKKGVFSRGFTVVELIIVIVVIAILASISVVSYSGFRQSAVKATILSDLKNASTGLELMYATRPNDFSNLSDATGTSQVSDIFKTSPGIKVNTYYSVGGATYNSLSPVQNAVLFQTVCSSLSTEYRPDASDLYYGQGRNKDGGIVKFVWGPDTCNVYNKTDIQFNSSWGFAGGQLSVPVSAQKMTNFINSISNTDTYFPDATLVARQYYQTVTDRFQAQGGVFPITTFWDGSWCQVGQNWCTAKESLPPPTPVVTDQGYHCVEAYSEASQDVIYRISSDNKQPTIGKCH